MAFKKIDEERLDDLDYRVRHDRILKDAVLTVDLIDDPKAGVAAHFLLTKPLTQREQEAMDALRSETKLPVFVDTRSAPTPSPALNS